jgi:TRAP transporter TAXI family solute receptor
MRMSRKSWIIVGGVIAAIVIVAVVVVTMTAPPKAITIKWGSSKEGTAGYVSLYAIADVVRKYAPEIMIEATPTAGSIASQRMVASGDLDAGYSGVWNMKDMYLNRGPYEGNPWPAGKPKLLHTLYYGPTYHIVVTRADRTDIKCLKDLKGKKLFIPIPGSSVFEVPKAVLKLVGVWDEKMWVDMPTDAVPDALKIGTIDAVFGYVASGPALPGWMKELEARIDIKVVPPSPDEIKILEEKASEAGFSLIWLDTSKAFTKPVGVEKVLCPSDMYGFNAPITVPEEVIYKIVKIVLEHTDELVKYAPYFKELQADPIGIQVKAINAAPEIPVHPGLAKYLKEKGAWNPNWKVAS